MNRYLATAPILAALLWFGAAVESYRDRIPADRIASNDNRSPAGTESGGVRTVRMEARVGEWHPDRDGDPGLTVRAFAEEGKALQIPGPLIRVRAGTTVNLIIRNALGDAPLVIHGLTAPGTTSAALDTLHLKPGETRTVRFVATKPGSYFYWGTTTGAANQDRPGIDSQLSGAIVVDGGTVSVAQHDRIFVIGLWTMQQRNGVVARDDLLRFVINGRAWPNTERLAYTVGDSVRFRIINATSAPHPMHLHGFYFNVEARGNGRTDQIFDPAGSRHMAVTERAGPGNTFSLLWVPERAGNWMFHCHDNFHVLRNRPLDGTSIPAEEMLHVTNHATDMMGGLVMGIEVKPRRGEAQVAEVVTPKRNLRLVAGVDAGGTPAEPAYGYALQDRSRMTAVVPMLPGPVIVLTRDEPVRITVVNALPEPTAVHWHGIELDSYYDGVADFAGHPGRLAPAIAPRDSFEARFTPPRAGTFMYHPHADEVRQQQAGLSGAMVVLEPGKTFDPEHDVVLLISVPRRLVDQGGSVLLNGTSTPAVRNWRVGQRYRLRIVNIHTARPSMIARLVRDSTIVDWKAVAKDGMDLPADQATSRPATQQLGNGETYDFEFAPTTAGDFRFTVSAAAGPLLVSLPIRVR